MGSIKLKLFIAPEAVEIADATLDDIETSERERNGYVIAYINAPIIYKIPLVIIVECF